MSYFEAKMHQVTAIRGAHASQREIKSSPEHAETNGNGLGVALWGPPQNMR